MAPRDKDNITQKSGLIYRYKCNRLECEEKYKKESARTFREELKEHLRALFPNYDHVNTSGHPTKLDNLSSIVGRGSHTITRTTKEATVLRVNDVSLNRIIGKYQLPHIWDEVLCTIPGLHLK